MKGFCSDERELFAEFRKCFQISFLTFGQLAFVISIHQLLQSLIGMFR